MIWKCLAIAGGLSTGGLLLFLWWLARDISDGFAAAFGMPRRRRWRLRRE